MMKKLINEMWDDAIMFVNPRDFYKESKDAIDFNIFLPFVMILSIYLMLRSIIVLIPIFAPFKFTVWALGRK